VPMSWPTACGESDAHFNFVTAGSLRTQLARARQEARDREVHIQRLLNENQEMRDWYGARLPDGISRMHARPAFASAADYLHWLSGGHELPDTGKLTGH